MVCELHARLPAGRVGRANCASLNGVTPFHNAQKQPEGLLGVPLSCELDWTHGQHWGINLVGIGLLTPLPAS